MTQVRKLALTGALFAATVGLVVLTAVIHTYGPLFVAWAPLVAAAWILAQREPGYVPPPLARPPAAEGEAREGPAGDGTDAGSGGLPRPSP